MFRIVSVEQITILDLGTRSFYFMLRKMLNGDEEDLINDNIDDIDDDDNDGDGDEEDLINDHIDDNEGSRPSNSRRTVDHDWTGTL